MSKVIDFLRRISGSGSRQIVNLAVQIASSQPSYQVLLYRGTGFRGAINEMSAIKEDGSCKRSTSICRIDGVDYRSSLWRKIGFVFPLSFEEFKGKACSIGARDGFTGRGCEEDEFGNLIDDNETQQSIPTLSEERFLSMMEKFVRDSDSRLKILQPLVMNEALLELRREDYDRAIPCMNADFSLCSRDILDFTKMVQEVNEFRAQSAAKGAEKKETPVAVQYKGKIHFVEAEYVKDFLFILERGFVPGSGVQDVASVVMVGSKQIEASSSSKLDPKIPTLDRK